jgi:hypothetical protein
MQRLTDRVWMRSREEEKGPVRVYRPEDYPFPLARGREGLMFHRDGTFEYIAPGRGDVPGKETGRWRSAPGNPARITAEISGTTIELNVLEVTDEVLRLEWVSP